MGSRRVNSRLCSHHSRVKKLDYGVKTVPTNDSEERRWTLRLDVNKLLMRLRLREGESSNLTSAEEPDGLPASPGLQQLVVSGVSSQPKHH